MISILFFTVVVNTLTSVFAVPQEVKANLEIRVGTDSFTQEEKLEYTLMSITPVVNKDGN